MFARFKKSAQKDSVVSVTRSNGGLAISRVREHDEDKPLLDVCDFSSCEQDDMLRDTLKALVMEHCLEGEWCNYVLSPGQYELYMIEAPEMDEDLEKIKLATKWRIKDLIDFPIDQAVVDILEIPESDYSRRKNHIYVVVSKKELINQIARMVESVGLQLYSIDIPELALRNLTTLNEFFDDTLTVANLNGSGGQLTILQKGYLYISRKIDIDLRRWVERNILASNDDHALTGQDKRVLDDLVLELQRSMDYCCGEFAIDKAVEIVISPIDSDHGGELAQYINENIEIKTGILDINDFFRCENFIEYDIQSRCIVAVGGAMRYVS